MPDASYDIVIAGMDLPGLALGALCAKAGYTVLVVGQDTRYAEYQYRKHPMLRRPPLCYGFATSPVIRSVFHEIGLIAEMRNRPVPLQPSLQVVTPGRRYEIGTSRENLTSELNREFATRKPQELLDFWDLAAPVDNVLGEFLQDLPLLPVRGLFSAPAFRRKMARALPMQTAEDRLSFPPEMSFSGPLTAVLHQILGIHPKPLPSLVVRRLLQHVSHGLFEFPGGETGLARMFCDRIRANSGQVWDDRSIRDIRLKGKIVQELLVEQPSRTVRTKLLVVNTAPKKVLGHIAEEQQIAAVHSDIASVPPSWYRYALNFVVDADCLPDLLARHLVLVMDPLQEVHSANALWITTTRPSDPEMPAVISVFCRIPAKELPKTLEDYRRLNLSLRHAVEWVLPFLPEKTREMHTPYLSYEMETDLWKPDPAEFQEIPGDAFPDTLGLSSIPAQTKYRNVLLLGSAYLAGLGLEGAFLGARQGFQWVRKNVVLKTVLR